MSANWNWLHHMHGPADEPGRQAMPVFEGQKLVVVGGSSGMGRQTATDVVAAGGSAVIIGQDLAKVDDTVQTLAKDGKAYGITADLTDRNQVDRVRQQLAGEHADATLLVNAAGFFIPKPFLEHDGAFYDSYLELDRAIFFLTQTVARGMVEQGRGGSIVNIGSMWAHKAIAATPSSAYSVARRWIILGLLCMSGHAGAVGPQQSARAWFRWSRVGWSGCASASSWPAGDPGLAGAQVRPITRSGGGSGSRSWGGMTLVVCRCLAGTGTPETSSDEWRLACLAQLRAPMRSIMWWWCCLRTGRWITCWAASTGRGMARRLRASWGRS
jgi:hypothetical protein